MPSNRFVPPLSGDAVSLLVRLGLRADHRLGERLLAVHSAGASARSGDTSSTLAVLAADQFEADTERLGLDRAAPNGMELMKEHARNTILPTVAHNIVNSGIQTARDDEVAAAGQAQVAETVANRARELALERLRWPLATFTSGEFSTLSRAEVYARGQRLLEVKAMAERSGDLRHRNRPPSMSTEVVVTGSLGATEAFFIVAPAINFSFQEPTSWAKFGALSAILFLAMWGLVKLIGSAVGELSVLLERSNHLAAVALTTSTDPIFFGTLRVEPDPQPVHESVRARQLTLARRGAVGWTTVGAVGLCIYTYIVYGRVQQMAGRQLTDWPTGVAHALPWLVAFATIATLSMLTYAESRRSALAEDLARLDSANAETMSGEQNRFTRGVALTDEVAAMEHVVTNLLTRADVTKSGLGELVEDMARKFSYLVGFDEVVLPDPGHLLEYSAPFAALATARMQAATTICRQARDLLDQPVTY